MWFSDETLDNQITIISTGFKDVYSHQLYFIYLFTFASNMLN